MLRKVNSVQFECNVAYFCYFFPIAYVEQVELIRYAFNEGNWSGNIEDMLYKGADAVCIIVKIKANQPNDSLIYS